MLEAKIICDIKESEKVGDKLTKEFKELDCAIEQGIGEWDLIKWLGDLNQRYEEWKENHKRLLLRAYVGTHND